MVESDLQPETTTMVLETDSGPWDMQLITIRYLKCLIMYFVDFKGETSIGYDGKLM